jgi:RES domain-containing protein
VHDPKLLEILASLEATEIRQHVFRVLFAARDPTAGSLAGGRWAPPQQVSVLYTSFDADCAIAEVHFHFSRQPVFPTQPVALHTLDVVTQRTVVLTDIVLATVGVTRDVLASADYSICQRVGHAAHFLGIDGIVAPSVRGDASNLVLFLDRLRTDPEVLDTTHVDWESWRRRTGTTLTV